MYKLILADDEVLIRNNMKKGIHWENYGFELTGCYSNGVEVLEALNTVEADLVITDISMPYMDGIELAKNLYRDHPKVKIIFLTGYSEFEYAKKAMEYGVSQYILKPIDREDIGRLLSEMKQKLDSEADERNHRMVLEDFYHTNQILLRSIMIRQILDGQISASEVRLRRDMLNLKALDSQWFQAAIICPDVWKTDTEERIEECKMRVFQRMQQRLDEKNLGFVTLSHEGCNVLLCSSGCISEKCEEKFEDFFESFRISIQQGENFTVTIGIGCLCDSLELVHNSSREAETALKYQDLIGNNRLIFLKDMEPDRDGLYWMSESAAEQILETIKLGNEKELEKLVDEYREKLYRRGYDTGIIRLKMLDAVSRVSEQAVQMGNPVSETSYGNTMRSMINARSVDEIMELFLNFGKEVQREIAEKRDSHYSSMVRKVKRLVAENYMDAEFGIEQVCERMNLSESYLRSVFKKETDTSFGNYLKEVRMGKAKELLLNTDMLNYEIAEKVGYNDSGYFGYCFKKYFRMSPNDMRRKGELG